MVAFVQILAYSTLASSVSFHLFHPSLVGRRKFSSPISSSNTKKFWEPEPSLGGKIGRSRQGKEERRDESQIRSSSRGLVLVREKRCSRMLSRATSEFDVVERSCDDDSLQLSQVECIIVISSKTCIKKKSVHSRMTRDAELQESDRSALNSSGTELIV